MEPREKLLLLCRFDRNSSVPGCKWTEAKQCSGTFHATSMGPIKSHLNAQMEVRSPLPRQWYHLCAVQCYTMMDLVPRVWYFLTAYPPRNVSAIYPYSKMIRSGRNISSSPSSQPKNVNHQVSKVLIILLLSRHIFSLGSKFVPSYE
jgi:hypothetical protein